MISQPRSDTRAADGAVTPADEHTHCKPLAGEGRAHICIEPVFPPVSDPTRCLQHDSSTESILPRALQSPTHSPQPGLGCTSGWPWQAHLLSKFNANPFFYETTGWIMTV